MEKELSRFIITDRKKKMRNKKEWAVYLVFAVVAIGLIIRAHYGMDLTDETFYLATAKRFSEGDLAIKYDWNTAQIFGLLLVPVYRIYTGITGSNEGIIIFMRILLVLAEWITAMTLYSLLKKMGKNTTYALLIAICFFVYVRGNIITFSYYSMGMLTFLWMIFEVAAGCYLLAGIFYAISVLCMPYMAVLFAVILGYGIWALIKNHRSLAKKVWYLIAGVFLSAAGFIVIYGRYIPWSELFLYIPQMLKDPTMEKVGMLQQVANVGVYYVKYFLKYTWPMYLISLIGALILGSRKEERLRKIWSWLLILEFFIQAVYVRTFFEAGIISTFFFLGVQMQLLYPEYRERKLEKYFLYTGIAFAIPWILGSNVGQRVIHMGILIMDVWAAAIVYDNVRVETKWKKTIMIMPLYILVLVLGIIRFCDIYRDGFITELNSRIEIGIMKGIYTEDLRASAYESAVDCLKKNTNKSTLLAVAGCNPWAYLDSEAQCAAYSPWEMEGDALLKEYYEMFPEKIPTVIFVPTGELSTYKSWRFSSHGSGMHEGKNAELNEVWEKIIEGKLLKKIEENGNILYKSESGRTSGL